MALDRLRRLFSGADVRTLPAEDARSAIAAILVMAARADGSYEGREQRLIDQVLADRYGLDPSAAAGLRVEGEAAEAEAIDHYQFTRSIRLAVTLEDRTAIVEALWKVVLADASRDPHEDSLMRQLVERLGLSPMDSALARQRVAGGGSTPGL
ncbi:MAG: TerB family tellurite resistance protein [Alphaproteobacteria bacterium]|nr:TerB family tellurite resistance protein [Alphaproteobacteria bacterium]